MSDSKRVLVTEKTAGDAAVDGLLAGIGAGFAGAAYLLIGGLAGGETPDNVLARFDPTLQDSSLVGGLMHLATSAVYGLLFAVLFRLIVHRRSQVQRWGWLLGAVYGLLLWFLAETVFASGLNSTLADVPTLHFAIFHIVYGLALGFLAGRMGRVSNE